MVVSKLGWLVYHNDGGDLKVRNTNSCAFTLKGLLSQAG